jgi:hypothetical protein
MATDQNIPQEAAANRPRDMLLRLYREIGISAVAAALDATARKPQTPPQSRKDISAVFRGDEVARRSHVASPVLLPD